MNKKELEQKIYDKKLQYNNLLTQDVIDEVEKIMLEKQITDLIIQFNNMK